MGVRYVRLGGILIVFIVAIGLASPLSLVPAGAAHTGGHAHPADGVRPSPQVAATDSSGHFHCQMPAAKDNCYGAAQMRNAYSIQPLLDQGLDGSGRTIAIIDAFQNPTMTSDLATFDARFGLPAPPSFEITAPFGTTPFDPKNANEVSWSGEIALDVEWAHTVAPGAGIVLALAPSDADADLIATEAYVINHRMADVISMSYGEAEQCKAPALQQQEHALFDTATALDITLLAGSGDEGAAQFACNSPFPCTVTCTYVKGVSTPASDPDVTGIGGTDLIADLTTGAYGSESVWNEPALDAGGGGGFSALYSRPSFQNAVTPVGSTRGVPDVSYSASLAHAVLVAWGSGGKGFEFWIFYGTSAGTPQWAGIAAIADQASGRDLGNLNPALYRLGQSSRQSPFHDITTGNNDFQSISGYAAVPGWDAASGWGSPIASVLVADLAKP